MILRWFLCGAALFAGCKSSGHGAAPDLAVPAPYTLTAFDDARITSDGAQANFQKLRSEIDFHDGPFAKVLLVIDLRSTCYPFESWRNNPPPDMHNWPEDCDAFDRNFEFTLDDEAPTAIELVRAITPFGGPLHLEADVTDVANGLPGKHTLQAFIATWSDASGGVTGAKGGWNVSARLEVTPGGPPRKVLAVLPLLNLSLGAGDSPTAKFTVPAGATATRLEYRATGHGGVPDTARTCVGPAEEFCQRTHHLRLDGAELQEKLQPWRDDCYTLCTPAKYGRLDYCLENPCGAIGSVEAPRANWCPGSLTPPFVWEPTLAAGEHELAIAVDGAKAGGSWRLSALLFVLGM